MWCVECGWLLNHSLAITDGWLPVVPLSMHRWSGQTQIRADTEHRSPPAPQGFIPWPGILETDSDPLYQSFIPTTNRGGFSKNLTHIKGLQQINHSPQDTRHSGFHSGGYSKRTEILYTRISFLQEQ